MQTSSIALLAPIPYAHLEDGVEVCREQGRVAFGTRAWQLFRELEGMAGIPVLIYASRSNRLLGRTISWDATLARYLESPDGFHPDGSRLRPPSTQRTGEDRARHWAGFYEVADLRELDPDERIPIGELRDRKGRRYPRSFVPEGPMIISAP